MFRRRKEAESVDERQKITSFGFLPVNPSTPVETMPTLTRSEIEISQIEEMFDNLQAFIQPVMKSGKEGSKVDSIILLGILPSTIIL